ncbi:glycosyltransferase family 2 protein [Candidatus Beckwithbacteria bacterium]|nr:glycosyltransferase family 2 protein [Candidatus Beckwithbacteria bacterium]
MNKLSVVILVKNAGKTLQACLDSVKFADEIILMDDFSIDSSVAIIEKFSLPQSLGISYREGTYPKIRYYLVHLKNDFSYIRNKAMRRAKNNWVLFLDADEYLTPQLEAEIRQILTDPKDYKGFYFKRKDIFFGKTLRYGETGHIKLLRLGRKWAGQWQGNVHETWHINGKVGSLKAEIMHDRQFSSREFLDRLDWYSTLQAQSFWEQKRQEPFIAVLALPLAKFCQNYIFKLGLLDGFAGLTMAWLMSWHSLLVRIKLRILWQNHGQSYFAIPE